MEEIRLGRRVRALRQERGLSLRALSRTTGIAVSFLSGVENGKHSVSVTKLKTILDALGNDLGTFFSQQPPSPKKVVYRKDELTEIAGPGNGLSFLEVASGRPGRALQLIIELYEPGADTGPGLYHHEAEEAGIVLKGKLELTLDGNTYILKPGDAYYFDSRCYHRMRNVGKGEAKAISVNTPPSF
jgi:transcriptional regulator with XRE-family HTH domain